MTTPAPVPRDTKSRSRPLIAHIQDVDPTFNRDKHWAVEYEFSNGRKFEGRTDSRGPYATEVES